MDDAGVAEAHVLEDPDEERAAHTVIGLGQVEKCVGSTAELLRSLMRLHSLL